MKAKPLGYENQDLRFNGMKKIPKNKRELLSHICVLFTTFCFFLATCAHGGSSEVSKRSTVPPEGQRERLIEVRRRALSGLYNHIFCLIPAAQ